LKQAYEILGRIEEDEVEVNISTALHNYWDQSFKGNMKNNFCMRHIEIVSKQSWSIWKFYKGNYTSGLAHF
jgi:hypothetical protein